MPYFVLFESSRQLWDKLYSCNWKLLLYLKADDKQKFKNAEIEIIKKHESIHTETGLNVMIYCYWALVYVDGILPKGPYHDCAWQIGPFWHDTLDVSSEHKVIVSGKAHDSVDIERHQGDMIDRLYSAIVHHVYLCGCMYMGICTASDSDRYKNIKLMKARLCWSVIH